MAPTGSDATETVGPRFGLRHTTEGSGYDRFGSFETFFPLFQTPGSQLTFLEGRLSLSSQSTLGGNAVLGYRSYNASRNRILGGYLAYDRRDTGESIFNQIGAGLESLGDDWDLRANAYIPVGNTRNQISESFGAAFFQQNSLRLERVRQYEAAMAGADIEGGGRLLALGDGDLRGYAGVYYYWAEGSESVLGVKGRLVARPTDYLGLSVSVQNDPLFDTSVVFSLAVNFPGSRPRGTKPPSALARIGESVDRQTAIIADGQRKTDTVAAARPDSGNPFRFLHVNLGAGGSGSFESPYGSIAAALNAAQPGDIVYVQSGNNPGVAGFEIPDGVSVLSTAPVQQIDTAQRRSVVLPLSGTGVQPLVTGTVTIGNNSTVSGLAIAVADDGSADTLNPGIAGNNISNPTIRDNIISSADGSGILLDGVSGQLEIANNTVSNSGTDGIRVNVTGADVLTNANISGNRVTASGRRGIRFDTLDSAQVQQVSIGENTVSSSFFQGILVNAAGSSRVGQVNVTSNQISDSGAAGILSALGENSRIEQIAIESNQIEGSDAQGIWILPAGNSSTGLVGIRSNTISNSGLNRNPTGNAEFDFTGFLNGIHIDAEPSESGGIERLLIESNTITNSAENSISINATTSLRLLSGVRFNSITGSGNFGIIAETLKTGNLCLQLRDNQSDRNFQLTQTSGTFQVEDTLTTNSGAVSTSGTITTVPLGTCQAP
ncbi:right-handed parallel beta-helix repeat-containing protein [[Phormidium] sp. ETS-05]|uniref:right-handed parallel beta-helix repeat-containing protein n=1 Tax=[Phormidium] sp. ETS-05 TaxID=222819 RepID=UPI0018EECFF1|nr:right-handed parallel beta-helix repeat-containing protein [[Phormidium] sp. ETS-05]